MAATDPVKKALILSKWAEYKARAEAAGMEPVQAQFVKQSQLPGNEEWRTNIGTLRNYLDLNPSRRKDGDPHSHSHTHGHHILAIPDSPEAINEQLRVCGLCASLQAKPMRRRIETGLQRPLHTRSGTSQPTRSSGQVSGFHRQHTGNIQATSLRGMA